MKTALVVDDEPLLRRQVAETLTSYGFDKILEANDGAEAVAAAEQNKPMLIVMDVTMPVMDGVTAAEKIGKIRATPIVLLTGNTDRETLDRARESGVMSYLLKPFNEDQLVPAIDLAIHHFIQASTLRDEITKLEETLETRKLVERAKAALIKQGLSEPEAYRKLQKTAMDKRRSMKEVAEAILLMAE